MKCRIEDNFPPRKQNLISGSNFQTRPKSACCPFFRPIPWFVSYTRFSRSLAFPICQPLGQNDEQMQSNKKELRTSFLSLSRRRLFTEQKDKSTLSAFSHQPAKNTRKRVEKRKQIGKSVGFSTLFGHYIFSSIRKDICTNLENISFSLDNR